MPPKSAAARTPALKEKETGSWGTRFDSLNPSSDLDPAQVLPPSADGSKAPANPTLPPANMDVNSAPVTNTPPARSWSQDYESVSPLQSNAANVADAVWNSAHKRDSSKMPHDASVFVGSLPPNVDESELTRLLGEHLSQYANIQNVKIIHDVKGGLCAFVQCENAVQAAQIISQSRASQQLFLGRQLRYEAARAFRSLLISYRTPVQFVSCERKDIDSSEVILNEEGVPGRFVELNLVKSIRLWRSTQGRYPQVLYKGDAEHVASPSPGDVQSASSGYDPLSGNGLFITNLQFDEQTLNKIAAAFGPLESFRVFAPSTSVDESGLEEETSSISSEYPPPHDSPRSQGMDPRVWEVKWGHRDDCVCALIALRRIPHITVTWAHSHPPASLHSGTPFNITGPQTPRHALYGRPPRFQQQQQRYFNLNMSHSPTSPGPLSPQAFNYGTYSNALHSRGVTASAGDRSFSSNSYGSPRAREHSAAGALGTHGIPTPSRGQLLSSTPSTVSVHKLFMGPSVDDTPPVLADDRKEAKQEDLAVDDEELGPGWTVVGKAHPTKKIDMGRISVVEDGQELKLSRDLESHTERQPPRWSETDFPPLASRNSGLRTVASEDGGRTTDESTVYDASAKNERPSLPGDPNDDVMLSSEEDCFADMNDIRSLSRPKLSHRRSLSNPTLGSHRSAFRTMKDGVQEVDVEPFQTQATIQLMTPELDPVGSPLTPKSPSVLFPKTPVDPEVPTPCAIEEVHHDDINHPKLHSHDEHGDTRYPDSPVVLGADSAYPYVTRGHDNSGEKSGKYFISHPFAPGPGRDQERERDIDPFTVFVGGLDTVGMNTWDEERLRGVFGQYGFIDDIKVVRPASKKVAFAFVKFDNQESPLRAISEQHNRTYNGRAIRVQLRENNPVRIGWRNGGGKHFYQGPGGPREFWGSMRDREHEAITGAPPNILGHGGPNLLMFPNATKQDHRSTFTPGPWSQLRQDRLPPSLHPPQGEIDVNRSPSRTIDTHSSQVSQEIETRTSASITPPPSSLGPSASVTTPNSSHQPLPAPYGYYAPPPSWIAPYPGPLPYPVPFGTYPAYLPQPVMQYSLSPSASDGGSTTTPPTASGPGSWPNHYRPFMPYGSYPYMPAPQPSYEQQTASAIGQASAPLKPQPPLVPTGFVQGEHGTLIPIYQPEALDQYMNTNTSQSQGLNQSQAHAPDQAVQASVPQPQVLVPPSMSPVWPGMSTHPMYTYPAPATGNQAPTIPPPPVLHPQMIQQHGNGQPPVIAALHTPAAQPSSYGNSSSKSQQSHPSQNVYQGSGVMRSSSSFEHGFLHAQEQKEGQNQLYQNNRHPTRRDGGHFHRSRHYQNNNQYHANNTKTYHHSASHSHALAASSSGQIPELVSSRGHIPPSASSEPESASGLPPYAPSGNMVIPQGNTGRSIRDGDGINYAQFHQKGMQDGVHWTQWIAGGGR